MKKYQRINVWITIFIFFLVSIQALFAEEFQPATGYNGMVVSEDAIASQVGLNILRKGGNAVDAAVAVAFTLAVTFPNAGNIGGGGFMMVRTKNNNIFALDYREKAPLKASKDMYLDADGNVVENESLLGYKSAGVPGTVAGLVAAYKKFGSLPWRELVKPAIQLATKGFVIDAYKEESLLQAMPKLMLFSSSQKVFFPGGVAPKEGERLIQKDLANTLQRIADKGRDGFYKGQTARLLVSAMKKNTGLITQSDLDAYTAKWREPIHFTYRDNDLYVMPLPSSGGILMAEIFNVLEAYNLAEIGFNSSNLIHLWVEAERQAYADRAEFMGDDDFVDVPVKKLISKKYGAYIRNKINVYQARSSETVGPSKEWMKESKETTHFSIVDKWGNAVSNTYTLNAGYGSKAVVEGAGFLLNDEMDDFSAKPGAYNLYGLLGSYANQIEPGKRMLSSMTPTIVTRHDSLIMAVGSPGGSRIITSVAQTISNVIDFKMNMRRAIEAPRFHSQWRPDVIYLEHFGFNRDVRNALRGMGHKIEEKFPLGSVQGVLRHPNGKLEGWSDPRRNGHAFGY